MPDELKAKSVTEEDWQRVLKAGNFVEEFVFWSMILIAGGFAVILTWIAVDHSGHGLWGLMGLVGLPNVFKFIMYPTAVERLQREIFEPKGLTVKYYSTCCDDGFLIEVPVP